MEKREQQRRIPVLAFRLADQHYALPIESVIEVAAMVTLTRVADAPPVLLGLANRHGDVLPVLDLRLAFGLAAEQIGLATLFIVCEVEGIRAGLVVDEVYQVKYIGDDALHEARGAGRFVTQVVSIGAELYQIIQLQSVFETHLSSM